MGCVGSRNSVLGRISKYSIASYEELKGLKLALLPIDDEFDNKPGLISARQFHNIFYDGFYAPYMTNQDYLLIIDCRDETTFLDQHVLTARWYGLISADEITTALTRHMHIVLYDEDGSGIDEDQSPINKLFDKLQMLKLDPVCLIGGIADVGRRAPHMLTGQSIILQEQLAALNWFPSIIDDGLWQGRIEQGANSLVLHKLGITHLLTIGDTRPVLALPGMTCLTIKWSDKTNDDEVLKTIKGAVAFISKARKQDGQVLVLGDQGVNRSAALIMAYLMVSKQACLEDVFYYVRGLKPSAEPSSASLNILTKFERDMFGKNITHAEDLW
ncbi:serine/threonine/tyrosine-interacting-like protein 1 [Artemia franciscana]|uniref:Tyrosine-protein phosphatase domain-containing protein n=1 Tax=Artemia franciscana TaxID=6661 RepID=A0AA88HYD3_ARTSF|nr:hypothetical protein QYM36_004358 [Artemia franciscana]